jgi:DNA primase catalytic subunit
MTKLKELPSDTRRHIASFLSGPSEKLQKVKENPKRRRAFGDPNPNPPDNTAHTKAKEEYLKERASGTMGVHHHKWLWDDTHDHDIQSGADDMEQNPVDLYNKYDIRLPGFTPPYNPFKN